MKVPCNYQGWVKLYRSILKTPVWDNPAAFRVYAALLITAKHMDVLETVYSIPVRLRPGQLTATQAEICDVTGFTRKTVRNGLGILTAVKFISCDCVPDCKFSIVTVHPLPHSLREGEISASYSGPTDFEKSGQPFLDSNANGGDVFDVADELHEANHFPESGPTLYRNKVLKEIKNRKNILFFLLRFFPFFLFGVPPKRTPGNRTARMRSRWKGLP